MFAGVRNHTCARVRRSGGNRPTTAADRPRSVWRFWRWRRRGPSERAVGEPKRTNCAAEEWFAVGPRVADWLSAATPRHPFVHPHTHSRAHAHTHTLKRVHTQTRTHSHAYTLTRVNVRARVTCACFSAPRRRLSFFEFSPSVFYPTYGRRSVARVTKKQQQPICLIIIIVVVDAGPREFLSDRTHVLYPYLSLSSSVSKSSSPYTCTRVF